jgi:hypothetical protein
MLLQPLHVELPSGLGGAVGDEPCGGRPLAVRQVLVVPAKLGDVLLQLLTLRMGLQLKEKEK